MDPKRDSQHAPRILTFDGGGVRGLSSLLILRDVMEEIEQRTNATTTPKPCEYFDLIAGTSTGGLIAIMLGRLEMSVQECIDAYLKLAEDVFRVDLVLANHIPVGDNQCRFNYKDLETAIKRVVKEQLGSEDVAMLATDKPGCRTFVVAKLALNASAQPTLFRSYTRPGFPSTKCTIWQAARATSAAPTFFKAMHISHPSPGMDYVDGGLGHNNPSLLAREEAKNIWPESKSCCLISIGTGLQKSVEVNISEEDDDSEAQRTVFQYIQDFVPNLASKIPGWKTARNIPPGVAGLIKMASTMSKLTTNSEEVHEQLEEMSREGYMETQFLYYRFNVESEVGDIGLGDWKKSGKMASLTTGYMAKSAVRDRKMKCIEWLLTAHTLSHKDKDPQTKSINEKDVENEIAYWTKLVDESPNLHRYQLKLAEAYSNTADVRKVIAGWVSLVDKHPDGWKLQTQLANVFASRGISNREKWHEETEENLHHRGIDNEIAVWKSLVTEHPRVWGLQMQLAKAFAKKGDIDEEINVWTELVDRHPDDWKLQSELAEAYCKRQAVGEKEGGANNSVEQEIKGWRKLIDDHPEQWELQVRLLDAYTRKAKLEETVRTWSTTLGSKRKEGKIVSKLRDKLGRRRDVNDEIEEWETLVDKHPENRGLQMQLEMAYTKKGNNDASIEGWKRLVNKHPEQRELAMHLKRAYERRGENADNIDQEIQSWEDLVRDHPDVGTLQTHLAEAYAKLDERDVEIAGWIDLLNDCPTEQELRDRLLHACLQSEDLDQAKDALEELDRTDPRNRELPLVLEEMYKGRR